LFTLAILSYHLDLAARGEAHLGDADEKVSAA
jgi:hypothetical protein